MWDTSASLPARPSSAGGDRRPWRFGRDRLNGFYWFVLACGGLFVAFTSVVGYRLGGAAVTAYVDDLGLAAVQFVAAGACFIAVRRTSGRPSVPWVLLGAAATSVGLGQLVWSVYELGFGITSPFPSIADLGNVIALPLCIAAGLTFPSAPGRATTRGRALADGAIIAIALILIAWVVGVAAIYTGSSQSFIGQAIGLVYMAGQLVMLTVLIMAIRRARNAQRYRLSFLTFAVLVNIAGITLFAYLTGTHRFGPEYRLLDSSFAFVYLAIAVAALWPGGDSGQVLEEGPSRAWAVATPAIVVAVAVLAVVVSRLVSGPYLSPVPSILTCTLVGLLLVSQMLTYHDSLGLLLASKRAEGEARASSSLLRQVVSHTPAGLARLDVDMRIVDANPRMGMLLNTQAPTLVGSSLSAFIPAEDVAKAVDRFQPFASSTTETVESHSQSRRADGTSVWVQWSCTAVRKPGGGIDYFLGLFEDVDAKYQAEQAAIANLNGLERLSRLKSEFVSMVSHEFRTALTGIQGFAELMREHDLEPGDVKTLSDDIFNDAMRLNRLITDMLDVDRMEAGRMTFDLTMVDVNAVILQTIERARATTTEHTVNANLDSDVPRLAADEDRLVQVLSNLLSNAIKYSPGGGAVVVISRLKDGFVEITVADHGKGIPAAYIDHLFERFERYQDHLSTITVGSGLGLAIARRIVEAHGGRIWVDSTVGVGSEFHFTLPVQTVEEAQDSMHTRSTPVPPGLATPTA